MRGAGETFDPGHLVDRIEALIGYERKVPLRPVRPRILDSFVLEGNVHLSLEMKRFSDGSEELMRDDRSFIPMTAVRA